MEGTRLNSIRENIPIGQANNCSSRFEADDMLIQKAIDGDANAFGDLYNIYLDRIYRYVLYLVKDKMTAEDLTEETFLKAWKSLKSCRGKGKSFSSWLYRIAHNRVIDEFRSSKNNRLVELDNLDIDFIQGDVNPVQQAEQALMQKDVLNLLQLLPLQQRQLMIFKFVEGIDNKEIEQITGMSQGAIRIMQMRAISALKNKLIREG